MNINNKKILIVEDDIVAAQFLRETLEDAGYFVLGIVSRAKESIQKANELKPDLILMDIILKDQMSGCEAALEIKQNHKNCKIIFLTAHAQKEMIEYAQQCQACAYLLKPYREDEILATIAVTFSQTDPITKKEIEEVLFSKGFSFHFKKCRLFHNNEEVPLTEKKLKLVECLAKNVDLSVSIEQICTYVWGEQRSEHTVRSLIYRVKASIGYDLIKNSSGAGYVIHSKKPFDTDLHKNKGN